MSLEKTTEDGRKSHVAIGPEHIVTSELVEAVRADECGAISTFEGTTRNTFDGKKVIQLEYEAYEPMALKEMMKLADHARTLWPDIYHIAMRHRIGVVPVRESSILIAVSSPHRRDAIAACEWLIDELKATVPVWKKEHYADGSVWKMNAECLGCSSRRPHYKHDDKNKTQKVASSSNGHGHDHGNGNGHDHDHGSG